VDNGGATTVSASHNARAALASLGLRKHSLGLQLDKNAIL
jgi:hypothetical protein